MIVAIIQARMGSTRLPGKVLKEVDGVPLLKYMVERVRKSLLIDQLVIATSNLEQNDVIVQFCKQNHIECFRGSENDVLSRHYECAKIYKADPIVRLTSDCPLADPEVIDAAITLFKKERVDYVSNTVPPKTSTFPGGSDVEIFSIDALERAYMECKNDYDREHITFCFFKHNSDFKTIQLEQDKDWSEYRFTIDYPEDLEVAKYVIKELKRQKRFGHIKEIIEIIDSNKKLKSLNAYWIGREKNGY